MNAIASFASVSLSLSIRILGLDACPWARSVAIKAERNSPDDLIRSTSGSAIAARSDSETMPRSLPWLANRETLDPFLPHYIYSGEMVLVRP
jgi:hypothetical protein